MSLLVSSYKIFIAGVVCQQKLHIFVPAFLFFADRCSAEWEWRLYKYIFLLMRILFFILGVAIVSLFSCNRNGGSQQGDVAAAQVSYSYAIAENLVVKSTVALPVFCADSLSFYSWYEKGGRYALIKDDGGMFFFATLISEMYPAILNEGIYSDFNDTQVRYFVYDDRRTRGENRNRVFAGVRISDSEQSRVQDFLDDTTGSPLLGIQDNSSNNTTSTLSEQELADGWLEPRGKRKVVIDGDTVTQYLVGKDSIITAEKPVNTESRFKKK